MDENKEREIVDILGKFYESLIEPKIEGIRKKLEEHDIRFKEILRHSDTKIAEVRKKQEEHDVNFKEILGHFDSIYHRFERLETEYYSITEALGRIEEKLDKEVGKEKELEKDLKGLKRQVINLLKRIEAVEKRLSTI